MYIEDIFDISKLKLYLELSTRGFILLTVNEKIFQEQLINIIKTYKKISVYALETFSIEQNNDDKVTIYRSLNLCKDKLSVLGKINLSRDVLLKQNRLFIFIVPRYISELIQKDYPDFYSYFILKESYINNHELFFEYILPNSGYLITKESQRASKRYYNSSRRDDLNDALNYFLHSKASQIELKYLKEILKIHLKTIDKRKEYDLKYYFNLLFKYAKVLMVQGEYEDSLNLFHNIFQRLPKETVYRNLYYNALIGMGDCFFFLKDYEDAQKLYENTIVHIENSDLFTRKEIDSYMKEIIYSRLALCCMKSNNFEKVLFLIESVLNKFSKEHQKYAPDFFDIYYNFFLILLSLDRDNHFMINNLLDIMHNIEKNTMQKAMYLTINAWYNGLMQGNLQLACKDSKTALQIKREVFRENDLRIAESHYTNSILYLLNGEYEKASVCCNKCSNILKNFRDKVNQEELVKKLYSEIGMRKSQQFT